MRYNVVETSLDDVLSDALREAAGTEIGLSNGFRFSPPLPAGPIRESDLWDWYPITTKLKVGQGLGPATPGVLGAGDWSMSSPPTRRNSSAGGCPGPRG